MAPARMAAANTLFSTVFQVAMGLGVALGALGVRLGHWLVHTAGIKQMAAAEFRLAFVLVALVSLLGMIDTWRLQAGSGDHLSKKACA